MDEQIDFYVKQMAFLGTEGVRGKTDSLRRKLLDLSRRIKVVVDLETREAVMEVPMPLWAIGTDRNVIAVPTAPRC